MKHVTFDFETVPFRPGYQAPAAVGAGFVWPSGEETILHWSQCEDALRSILTSGTLLVGHHSAFDMAVAAASFPRLQPLIFEAYEANGITCTMRRAQLLDIFEGKRQGWRDADGVGRKPSYALAALASRFLGIPMSKGEDSWQRQFGTLAHLPVESWPADAKEYVLGDVRATDRLYRLQESAPAAALVDQYTKARVMFGIQLMTVWGIRTNAEGVRILERKTQQRLEELEKFLQTPEDWGDDNPNPNEPPLIRDNRKRSRDTKAAKLRMIRSTLGDAYDPAEVLVAVLAEIDQARAEKRAVRPLFPGIRLTDTGNVSLDAEACEDSGDAVLEAYAEITSTKTTLAKDVDALLKGTTHPIHSRFDVVATGRKSSSGPNIQNPGRKGGVRECFVPRPGFVFLQSDFSTLELCTLAEYCVVNIGYSELARVLNAGEDPHITLGANLGGLTYAEAMERYLAGDPAVDQLRSTAKPGNFGLPGGMGVASFRAYAKQSGVILSEEDAKRLKEMWHRSYPEMRAYFKLVESRRDPRAREGDKGQYMVHQLYSNRVRGLAPFPAACNSPFQGLGADASDAAHWAVTRAMYTDMRSPLYGCHLVNYLHDELIAEVPDDDRLSDRGDALRSTMVSAANKYLPNVPVKASAAVAMRVWSKGAHRIERDGKLVPWDLNACDCAKCNKTRKGLGLK